jgi:hypothetical protein
MEKVKEFEEYIRTVMSQLPLEPEEREELREEWRQHLTDRMNDLLQQGYARSEAIEQAIRRFGDADTIRSEWMKARPPLRKLRLIRELAVWIACLAAAFVGPALLIRARYDFVFMAWTFVVLLACGAFYHGCIRRIAAPAIWRVLLPVMYGGFAALLLQHVSLKDAFRQMLQWHPGGDGLFTIPVIHLLWAVLVFDRWSSRTARSTRRLAALKSSFRYWAMILSALLIVNTGVFSLPAEGKVLALNVFLLYAFLQETIDSTALLRVKNKWKIWLG